METKQDIPITVEEDGSWRVAGARVTVEVLLDQFMRGCTPEQILDDFPTVPLASIYGIIGYFLSNRQAVEEYIASRDKEAKLLQTQCEGLPGTESFRQNIRDARDRLASGVQ